MKYLHGDWAPHGPPTPAAGRAVGADADRFDLIVGSDLLYERDVERRSGADSWSRHAKLECEVWIVDPDRSNRPAFNSPHGRGTASIAARGAARRGGDGDDAAYKGRLLVYRRKLDRS